MAIDQLATPKELAALRERPRQRRPPNEDPNRCRLAIDPSDNALDQVVAEPAPIPHKDKLTAGRPPRVRLSSEQPDELRLKLLDCGVRRG